MAAAVLWTSFAMLLVAVTLSDLRTRLVPDRALVAALVPALGALALGAPGALPGRLAAATGAGVFMLAAALARPGGMGLGDVKLAAVLAFVLGLTGWPAVLLGVLAPYLINGPVAVYLLLSRRATRHTPLPFGPALLTGALLAFTTTR
jgi:leader peptidase (prepilin peptidase)/N-methyltransferase